MKLFSEWLLNEFEVDALYGRAASKINDPAKRGYIGYPYPSEEILIDAFGLSQEEFQKLDSLNLIIRDRRGVSVSIKAQRPRQRRW
jgi:hypothetical protein